MNEINHEYYVSLEVAKLLKEAGFDWNTFCCYRNNIEDVEMCHVDFNWNMDKKDYEKEGSDNIFHRFITSDERGLIVDDFVSAPTLDVAQRWLREVKTIDVYIFPTTNTKRECVYQEGIKTFGRTFWIPGQPSTTQHDTYEEALESGIKKALKIILEKEK